LMAQDSIKNTFFGGWGRKGAAQECAREGSRQVPNESKPPQCQQILESFTSKISTFSMTMPYSHILNNSSIQSASLAATSGLHFCPLSIFTIALRRQVPPSLIIPRYQRSHITCHHGMALTPKPNYAHPELSSSKLSHS
jgi:hypothetical protein